MQIILRCDFKGALKCARTILEVQPSLRDFWVMRQLWPAVIQAQHSEKPEIQNLVEDVMRFIRVYFETSGFDFPVSCH